MVFAQTIRTKRFWVFGTTVSERFTNSNENDWRLECGNFSQCKNNTFFFQLDYNFFNISDFEDSLLLLYDACQFTLNK